MSFLRRGIICPLFIILLAGSSSIMIHSAHPSLEFKQNRNDSMDAGLSTNVTIYVLNLPGIPSSMGNASRFVEGIRDATRNGTYDGSTAYDALGRANTPGLQTSVMFRLVQVTDWTSYKQVIRNRTDFVLINSHGSYLPVPQGYTPEQWFDQILDAISNRYGAWVHIAGFPFYNAWNENSGIVSQGPGLFLRLAAYAGWSATIAGNPSRVSTYAANYFYHIDRWPKPFSNETSWHFVDYGTRVTTTSYTNDTLTVLDQGPGFHGFYQWSEDFSKSQCAVCRVYYSGVAAQVNGTTAGRYGLYVHFVPGVFGTNFVPNSGVDPDYGRGLISVLLGLEWQIEETVNGIELAKGSILTAEQMGQTQGLDQARNYLSIAKADFSLGHDLEAWSTSHAAVTSANSATVPWWTALWSQGWPYIALIGGIVGFSLIAALGSIVPSFLAATVGRLGNRIGWVERVSRFLRKKLSRLRKRDQDDVL